MLDPLLVPVIICTSTVLVATAAVRGDKAHPAVWLALLYLGSSVAALFVNPTIVSALRLTLPQDAEASLLGYSVCLTLFLIPSMFLRNGSVAFLNIRLVIAFVKYSTPAVLIAAVWLAPVAWRAASAGAHQTRFDLNNLGLSLLPEHPLTTSSVVVAHFYFLYAISFILLRVHRASSWLQAVAFLGSTLYILNALCFAARDGIVWFVMAYAWGVWYARPLASIKLVRGIRRRLYPVILGGMALFGLFSVQRFADQPDGGVIDYIVAYYGQQPYVFARTVESQTSFYQGKLRFPLAYEMAGRNAEVRRTEIYEWSFGTFVKDLYSEGGWLWLGIAATVVPPLVVLFLSLAPFRFPEAHALISVLYVQFMAQGVFYLRLGNRAGNLYALVIVLIAGAMVVYRLSRRARRVRAWPVPV